MKSWLGSAVKKGVRQYIVSGGWKSHCSLRVYVLSQKLIVID